MDIVIYLMNSRGVSWGDAKDAVYGERLPVIIATNASGENADALARDLRDRGAEVSVIHQ